MPAAVAPPPTTSRSTTTTRKPRSAKASAHAAPTIPAPTIATSYAGLPIFESDANAHAERIFRVQQQICFRIHKSRAPDTRKYFSTFHLDASFKNAADNALLPPSLPLFDFAVGIKASQLCAGASSARRTVVSFAGTKHEILAVYSRYVRFAE